MRRRGTFTKLYNTEGAGSGGSVMPPATAVAAATVAPEPEPEPRARHQTTCEGCGCVLDARGQIIRRGEGLRAHIAREDEVTRLTRELDAANQQVTELTARIAELTPAKRRSILM